jgi:hypothetical protein
MSENTLARTEPDDLTDESGAYEIPEELAEPGAEVAPPKRPPRSTAVLLAAVAGGVLLLGAALLVYRAHHRGEVLAEGLAKADALLRLDTAAGFREAASLLEPLAQLDPVGAASVRAFALAMLVADYRAAELENEAERLLVAPGRADVVPAHAHLAAAALALARREAGTAMTSAARAGDVGWARALHARVAFLAGNATAALEPAAAAAADEGFAPGLAVHGDTLRRLRRDGPGARASYEAALAASPMHPRAAYGLAKLALGGQAPIPDAAGHLERILNDVAGTPAPERARAALHLAALRLREGDRAAAHSAVDAVALDAAARAWATRAAAVAAGARGPYRAVSGAPRALQSASDDDPGVLAPVPPSPRPAAKAPAKSAAAKAVAPRTPGSKPSTTRTR